MPAIEIEYFKADSPVHQLHPLTKILFEFAVLIIAGIFTEPLYLALLSLTIVGIAASARIPLKKFKYMWVVLVILVFLILSQGIWFTSFGEFGQQGGMPIQLDGHTLFHLVPSWFPGGPRVPFVLEGAIYGLSLGLRFVAIALGFPILIMTTHPSDLVTFLAQIRVGRWKVPYNLIFVFTTALRYVPMVSREFDLTMDAQRSRGVEFGGLNLFRQIRASVPLFVPVLIGSLLNAQDVTLALETRAFGAPTKRTFIHEVHWHWYDSVALLALMAITITCIIASTQYGLGVLPYTPSRNF